MQHRLAYPAKSIGNEHLRQCANFIAEAVTFDELLVSGRAFSQLHGFVHISYGTNMATLKRGIVLLQKTIDDLKS